MPSGHDYETLLAGTARKLFDTSVLTASEVSEGWPDATEGEILSNEKKWSLQVELVWFLVCAICRQVFDMERGGVHVRDAIQDDLVSCVIEHMLDRSFDWSHEPSDKRAEQAEVFLRWYNEAEASFGAVTRITPSDHIALEDNLAGRGAMRMATTAGQPRNIGVMIGLCKMNMRAYMDAKVPRLTVDLVQALHARASGR